jgi:hypothetical protein
MISRGPNFKQIPLNIVGSSVFGRYPKISIEKTYNMFISDNFLVPYAGYQLAVLSSMLGNGTEGRGIYASTKLGRMVVVINSNVYLVNLFYDQDNQMNFDQQVSLIGTLQTSVGVVYIAENNKPQIAISDGTAIYVYDTTLSPNFQTATIDFVPGYITFHDTYFIAASMGTNIWRLSGNNDGLSWPDESPNVGALETKADNVQAVVRFPSKGNMVLVMGSTVTESWYDTGAQLFPYQRTNNFSIDYGCLNPATIAYMDEMVVWLAQNEKSGPIVMYTDGGPPTKITTDGFDYVFSQLTEPADSQGFLYRQDGHLIYHLNFYTDNLSLFYDFSTQKIYHACDQNLNYFIAATVAFFNNQYYFVTKNDGNLYAFDTIFTDYQTVDKDNNIVTFEIPRIRTCQNIRMPSQEYFIANDIGFTIESGETDYYQQNLGSIFLITQDSNFIITQDSNFLILQQEASTGIGPNSVPRVDLSISTDGGATFGSDFAYVLPPIGIRKNRLMWWQAGIVNDLVCQFKFWSFGRFVVTDGVVNIRQ